MGWGGFVWWVCFDCVFGFWDLGVICGWVLGLLILGGILSFGALDGVGII